MMHATRESFPTRAGFGQPRDRSAGHPGTSTYATGARALPVQYRRTSPYHPANRHPRSIWPAMILLAIVLAMVVYLASLVRVAAQEMREMGTQQTIAQSDTYSEEK